MYTFVRWYQREWAKPMQRLIKRNFVIIKIQEHRTKDSNNDGDHGVKTTTSQPQERVTQSLFFWAIVPLCFLLFYLLTVWCCDYCLFRWTTELRSVARKSTSTHKPTKRAYKQSIAKYLCLLMDTTIVDVAVVFFCQHHESDQTFWMTFWLLWLRSCECVCMHGHAHVRLHEIAWGGWVFRLEFLMCS